MAEQAVEDVVSGVDAIDKMEAIDPNNLTLDQLALLLNTERLEDLQTKTEKELLELKDRQDDVALLHDLMKAINNAIDADGGIDLNSPEIQELLEKVKKLGITPPDGKTELDKDERIRFIENIRWTVDDLNVKNDMQLQTVTRLTNERYESYQMARAIMKPLHDSKTNMARAISGR